MLDDDELQRIYQWVDEVPLSRPKRSIARDFADGVLVAEIVCHYFPKLIELHNYSNANGYAQKIYNWCVTTGGRARAEGAGCTWLNPNHLSPCAAGARSTRRSSRSSASSCRRRRWTGCATAKRRRWRDY
jgi:hypothetical protein